ncbi:MULTISPECIES: TRAP transporter small permease [Pseudophaeobacter]|uniref:TRAP transporter small permease n=1 Tax=Pseudophaeobacter TaxID=1541822 RepID=UPI002431DE39|nr:TRAP transporter small permease [Pseudophaeobacter profundi]
MKSWAEKASAGVNSVVEGIVACLMLALVLDVWLGVVDRYYFHWQLPWPEEFARYLMIWAAMLGVSCGVAGREHIGLTAFIDQLPKPLRRASLVAMDLLALALFLYVLWFGIAFANGGATRQAAIFGTSLRPYYAAIPVSAAIASLQLILVLLRDLGTHGEPMFEEDAV